MKASHKNLQVIVKNVRIFEWYDKIRISLGIYHKAAFRVLQGAPVPSPATDTDGSKFAAWNTASEDLYNELLFTTKGAACFVVRRFPGKTLDEGPGHGQRARAALHEIFDGCSAKVLRAKHAKMNSARMSPGQDPDEFLYERYSPRALQCVRPSRGTDGPSVQGHHPPRSSVVVRTHPHIPPQEVRLQDRRHSPHNVRYLCGQPCPLELDEGDCGARGCHARGRK